MGATEAPGVTGPPLEAGSPLKKARARRSAPRAARARPRKPGDATPAAKGPEHSPSKEEGESLPVAQPEGRGNSARVPRQPSPLGAGRGDTAGSRARVQRSILGTGAGSQTGEEREKGAGGGGSPGRLGP